MAQAQTIGFFTRKAAGGGYELSKIVSQPGTDGQPTLGMEVITYRTRLVEVQQIEHGMKEQLFGEAAWYPLAPPMVREPVRPPAHDGVPMSEANGLPDGMPAVVEDYANGGGLVGELQRRVNGLRSVIMPMLFVAAIWASVNVRPWVA